MREWIPISTSPKGRLALAAVTAFGARQFDEVSVGELAAAADVTTGAIYHHFGSKRGLYAFVREDVERRLLDRVEGALAAVTHQPDRLQALSAGLVIGFDFAVSAGFPRMLGEPPPASTGSDRFADLLTLHTTAVSPVLGRVLAAGWRAALTSVADGATPEDARVAVAALLGPPTDHASA